MSTSHKTQSTPSKQREKHPEKYSAEQYLAKEIARADKKLSSKLRKLSRALEKVHGVLRKELTRPDLCFQYEVHLRQLQDRYLKFDLMIIQQEKLLLNMS